jgi:3-keto-5-aminohexanoate cleavage enzyme
MNRTATAPLIINLAPTGMVPTRSQTPYVPLTAGEIITDVRRCIGLGVSMVHLHARSEDGLPTSDPNIYIDIISEIRAHTPEVIIIATTSGRGGLELKRRTSTLYLDGLAKPDMASLTPGSMNFSSEASINEPSTIQRLAEIMKERGIKPELEIFDLGMVNYARILIDKGFIEPPFYFNIILGNVATVQTKLLHLASIVNDLPPQSYWSLGGIGQFQSHANALGVVIAHGVRVGLEDNLWLDADRTRLASNADLVERIVRQADSFERDIARPSHVRQLLGLKEIL